MSTDHLIMFLIDDSTLDAWLREDCPYFDLSSQVLGLDQQAGRLRFHAREPVIACGTEEAGRLLQRLGLKLGSSVASGTSVEKGSSLLEVSGPAGALHVGWKQAVNILEYSSGIATRTRALVEAAHAVAPHVEIVSTRKGFPGTRALATKAILSGGGSPHRLGLSETILVFAQHRVFLPGDQAFLSGIRAWKRRAPEKKFLVEVTSLDEALRVAEAGADGLQFDKIQAAELGVWVARLRQAFPALTLIAAGGITPQNVAAYAVTGVDALATSTVFHGAPADIGATMEALP